MMKQMIHLNLVLGIILYLSWAYTLPQKLTNQCRSKIVDTLSTLTIIVPVLPALVEGVWGIIPDISNFPRATFPLGLEGTSKPPILKLQNFLSCSECKTIQDWATRAAKCGIRVCNNNLNCHVNKLVREKGESNEGKSLVHEQWLNEFQLSPSNKGGNGAWM